MNLYRIIKYLRRIFYFPDFEQEKKREFYFNIAVGIIFALLLSLVINKSKWGEENLNNIFDSFYIKKEASIMVEKPAAKEIVFIEIDDKTYQEWGQPLQVPRGELARAIDAAYQGGAKVIYPDILFDHPSEPAGDRLLYQTLEKISQENRDVSMVFPVTVGSRNDRKKNIYDSLIDHEEQFYRAIPGVVSSSIYETTVRYWRGYENIIIADNKQDIIWGVPLLVSMLARGDIEELNGFKDEILSELETTRQLKLDSGETIRLSTRKEDFYFQRIRFTIFPRDTLSSKTDGNLDINNVIKFSELDYFAGDRDVFQDKIVIIGNTSPDAGDIHVTPAGQMAGIYVVANAINTLVSGQQTAEAPRWLNLLFYALIILLTAYFFIYFHSFMANVLGTLILSYIFIRIIGFFFYFHFGIFLTSVVLIVLIGFYEIIDDVREVAAEFNQKRKGRRKT